MKTLNRFSLLGAAALILAGCTPDDGSQDLEDGQAAFNQGDYKKAVRYLSAGVATCVTNVDAYVTLARADLALGELTAAREAIGHAEELAGGDSDVRLLGAQIAWHAKDYAAARKGFTAVANDRKLPVEIRAEGWSGLGVVEMTENNRDLARVAFLRAIRLDRRLASARYHLGLLYRDSYNYPDAALEQFNVFVRLDASASPRVQKVQRTVISNLKEEIARAAAERPGATKRDSAASAAALAKAEAAWNKGNFKTARTCYETALKADPLSYPAALGLAKAYLKTDATKRGQSAALEAYRKACSAKPGAISTFIATGDLALKLGHSAEASEIFSRAVAADPLSLEALDGLIRTMKRNGRDNAVAQAYQSYRDSLVAARKK